MRTIEKFFPDRKYNSFMFLGVLFICFTLSVGVRLQQFKTWEKTPSNYFVGERPMMTTLDAPHWLRLAREYNENIFGQKSGLRGYPDHTDTFKEILEKKISPPIEYRDQTHISSSSSDSSSLRTPEIKYHDVPLLSFIIAHLAPYFTYNYYLTGTLLIPLFASLFIIPLGIYFFRIGLPLSGLLGGMIGTFSSAYFMRSSIGRIDTDMLNLFFPILTALFILLASKTKSEHALFIYSVVTGLSLFLFQWWYDRPGFALVFFVVFIFSLFIHQIRFRTILLSSLLFVLCVHPSTFLRGTDSSQNFLKRYFTIEQTIEKNIEVTTNNSTPPLSFPNTMTTISEADHVPMEIVFLRVLSDPLFGWVGFIALFGMAVVRWRVLLPLVPMLGLGLLSFQSSNRFIMFLAPFIGIGLGGLLSLVIETLYYLWKRYAWKHSGEKNKGKLKKVEDERFNDKRSLFKGKKTYWCGLVRQCGLYLSMGAFFWIINSKTAISFVPVPSINPMIYATFLEVKKRVPAHSALLTWWDYGYAITDATGLATFHDGGMQFGPKTYFTARGLISPDQDELYDITQFLATEGEPGIFKNSTSSEALLAAVRNPEHKPWNTIYLFFTADMTGKYGAISKLGSWDIEEGSSKPRTYQNLVCNKITNQEINCRGAKIDLKAGFINNKLALRRLIFIRNGQVLREQKFENNQGFTLQLIVAGNNIVQVQLVDEAVFSSNYNQMFLLGRYRGDLFEETYNAFPLSRLFRIKY